MLALALGCAWGNACAAPVSTPHQGLTLRGDYRPIAGHTRAMVLLHGTLAHHEMEVIETVQDLLEEREIASLAITLSLGVDTRRGMYPCDSVHRHREHTASAELTTWLHWLMERGIEKITLFGHSRGGNQVARFAAEGKHPRVEGLVLLAPASSTPVQQATRYERRHRLPLAQVLARAKRAGSEGLLNAVGFLHCDAATVSAEAFASYYAPDPKRDTIALLGELPLPVLVITGSEDTVVAELPSELTNRLDASARARVSHVAVDGAGHFFRDLYAEDVIDAIAEFLARP